MPAKPTRCEVGIRYSGEYCFYIPFSLLDEVVCSLVATKSSGYTIALAVALPIDPEKACTSGGNVEVIFEKITVNEHSVVRTSMTY